MCFTILAHKEGRLAPGKIEPLKVVNQTVHNALFAHGLAVQAIRENAKRKAKIGLAENLEATWPILDTENHIEASKNAFKDFNSQRLVPLFEGKYGEAFTRQNEGAMPDYTEEEMKTISTPLDYIGYNFYQGTPIRYSKNEKGYELVQFPIDYPKTDMAWPVTPKALYYAIVHTKDCFGNIPIYITENGMAAKDRETDNGEVFDLDRLEYLRMHLEMLSHAIADGGNVKGYFVWSLMDNFEWSHGYSKRFGIFRVNYSNMERTLKLSGKFYSDVIKKNAINGI